MAWPSSHLNISRSSITHCQIIASHKSYLQPTRASSPIQTKPPPAINNSLASHLPPVPTRQIPQAAPNGYLHPLPASYRLTTSIIRYPTEFGSHAVYGYFPGHLISSSRSRYADAKWHKPSPGRDLKTTAKRIRRKGEGFEERLAEYGKRWLVD